MILDSEQRNMLLLLGWLQLQCGRPERARVLLEALLHSDPANHQGRRVLVVSLLQMGDGVLAEHGCNELLAGGERAKALWLCLSRARQLSGRLEEAKEAYQQFLNSQEAHERFF